MDGLPPRIFGEGSRVVTVFWLIMQALGLVSVVAGVFLLAGLAVSLITGGVIVAVVAEMRT
jgi:hypothetical protein